MEEAAAASNGGLLYHEVQEGKLCAVHCVNTTLQGPFFSEFDLSALAVDLDQRERQVMSEGAAGAATTAAGDFLAEGEGSHNVSLGGDFSIQVLQKALEVWDLQVIPLDSPDAGSCLFDPELETAFICHLQDHWFCIRKECPMATEGSNGFGQWLTPDDARRITSSCNQVQTPTQQAGVSLVADQSEEMSEMDMIAAQQEEADLNAAIAASLMDTGGPFANYAAHEESRSQDAFAIESTSGEMSKDGNLEEQGANKSETSEPNSDNIESASGSNPKQNTPSLEGKESIKED
uniref:ubiquitinyl hydrolase 1 n=2 Tax=Oryza TaxID=4527 RepID=A0A0E0N517_ORYRU